jgi:acetyl esterase/lipase
MGEDPITNRARRAALLSERRHLHPTPGPIPEVSERDVKVMMRDGAEITIRIYTPQASLVPANGSPLYVAFHEGGFCMGDLTDEEVNCRAFSKEFGCVCANVDYRLVVAFQESCSS